MKSISRSSLIRQGVLASFLGALSLLFLFQHSVHAQAGAGNGRIEGTVTDASGSVIPGAMVIAREETTNIAASVSSEDDGHFVILYPGSRFL